MESELDDETGGKRQSDEQRTSPRETREKDRRKGEIEIKREKEKTDETDGTLEVSLTRTQHETTWYDTTATLNSGTPECYGATWSAHSATRSPRCSECTRRSRSQTATALSPCLPRSFAAQGTHLPPSPTPSTPSQPPLPPPLRGSQPLVALAQPVGTSATPSAPAQHAHLFHDKLGPLSIYRPVSLLSPHISSTIPCCAICLASTAYQVSDV